MVVANTDISAYLQLCNRRVETALDHWLPGEHLQPNQLHRAMRYAALGPGKRIRPVLVYAAGEAPITGADGRAIARAVRSRGRVEPVFVSDVENLATALSGVIRDGDLVVTMGAGSIGAVAAALPARLSVPRPAEASK